MKVVKSHGRHHTSDAGRNSLAGVTDKVVDLKQVAALLFVGAINLESPPVGESEEQLCMV